MHKCEIEIDVDDPKSACMAYHKYVTVRGFDESHIIYEDNYYDEVGCYYVSNVPRAKIVIKTSFIFWIQKVWFMNVYCIWLAKKIIRISKKNRQ